MEMDEAAAAEWQRGRQEAKALADEHQRLRDAVVEAAVEARLASEAYRLKHSDSLRAKSLSEDDYKVWLDNFFGVVDRWDGAKNTWWQATDALLAFERLHGLRKRD